MAVYGCGEVVSLEVDEKLPEGTKRLVPKYTKSLSAEFELKLIFRWNSSESGQGNCAIAGLKW